MSLENVRRLCLDFLGQFCSSSLDSHSHGYDQTTTTAKPSPAAATEYHLILFVGWKSKGVCGVKIYASFTVLKKDDGRCIASLVEPLSPAAAAAAATPSRPTNRHVEVLIPAKAVTNIAFRQPIFWQLVEGRSFRDTLDVSRTLAVFFYRSNEGNANWSNKELIALMIARKMLSSKPTSKGNKALRKKLDELERYLAEKKLLDKPPALRELSTWLSPLMQNDQKAVSHALDLASMIEALEPRREAPKEWTDFSLASFLWTMGPRLFEYLVVKLGAPVRCIWDLLQVSPLALFCEPEAKMTMWSYWKEHLVRVQVRSVLDNLKRALEDAGQKESPQGKICVSLASKGKNATNEDLQLLKLLLDRWGISWPPPPCQRDTTSTTTTDSHATERCAVCFAFQMLLFSGNDFTGISRVKPPAGLKNARELLLATESALRALKSTNWAPLAGTGEEEEEEENGRCCFLTRLTEQITSEQAPDFRDIVAGEMMRQGQLAKERHYQGHGCGKAHDDDECWYGRFDSESERQDLVVLPVIRRSKLFEDENLQPWVFCSDEKWQTYLTEVLAYLNPTAIDLFHMEQDFHGNALFEHMCHEHDNCEWEDDIEALPRDLWFCINGIEGIPIMDVSEDNSVWLQCMSAREYFDAYCSVPEEARTAEEQMLASRLAGIVFVYPSRVHNYLALELLESFARIRSEQLDAVPYAELSVILIDCTVVPRNYGLLGPTEWFADLCYNREGLGRFSDLRKQGFGRHHPFSFCVMDNQRNVWRLAIPASQKPEEEEDAQEEEEEDGDTSLALADLQTRNETLYFAIDRHVSVNERYLQTRETPTDVETGIEDPATLRVELLVHAMRAEADFSHWYAAPAKTFPAPAELLDKLLEFPGTATCYEQFGAEFVDAEFPEYKDKRLSEWATFLYAGVGGDSAWNSVQKAVAELVENYDSGRGNRLRYEQALLPDCGQEIRVIQCIHLPRTSAVSFPCPASESSPSNYRSITDPRTVWVCKLDRGDEKQQCAGGGGGNGDDADSAATTSPPPNHQKCCVVSGFSEALKREGSGAAFMVRPSRHQAMVGPLYPYRQYQGRAKPVVFLVFPAKKPSPTSYTPSYNNMRCRVQMPQILHCSAFATERLVLLFETEECIGRERESLAKTGTDRALFRFPRSLFNATSFRVEGLKKSKSGQQ